MADIEQEFVEGKIQAMFVSRLPKAFRDGNPNLARLFVDPQAEEERYVREQGYFPIMHVLAFKKELAARYPGLPRALYSIFEQARERTARRWVDPNWSMCGAVASWSGKKNSAHSTRGRMDSRQIERISSTSRYTVTNKDSRKGN